MFRDDLDELHCLPVAIASSIGLLAGRVDAVLWIYGITCIYKGFFAGVWGYLVCCYGIVAAVTHLALNCHRRCIGYKKDTCSSVGHVITR